MGRFVLQKEVVWVDRVSWCVGWWFCRRRVDVLLEGGAGDLVIMSLTVVNLTDASVMGTHDLVTDGASLIRVRSGKARPANSMAGNGCAMGSSVLAGPSVKRTTTEKVLAINSPGPTGSVKLSVAL